MSWIGFCFWRSRALLLSLLLVVWLRPPTLVGDETAPLPTGDAAPELRAEEPSKDVIPFNLRPYRVKVLVSITRARAGRAVDAETVITEIGQAIHRMYGRMWQLDLEQADWLRPGTVNQIAELDVVDLISDGDPDHPLDRYPEADSDKALLVGIASTTAGFDLICREYDTRTQDLSPVRRGSTPDAQGIVSKASQLIRDSFRPCLQYVRRYTDDHGLGFMQLQVQAGEIAAPDPAAEQVRPGDVLRPFQRFMKRTDASKLKVLRAFPLTYIQVTSVDHSVTRGLVTGALLTHGPVTPFGGSGRNVQQIALRQRSSATSSIIRLNERSQEQTPLVCQRVSVVYKLRKSDEETEEQLKMVSDREGNLTIPVHADYPTVWLYIYSGRLLLARIPYAPGIEPSDMVILPDDSIRLSVEGDLQLFRDDLIDAVALREVHFSMASRAADEGRAEDVEQHLKDYDAVSKPDEIRKALSLIRVDAVNRAAKEKNLRAQRAVENLCRDMDQTLELFFDDEKHRRRQQEIRVLRSKAEL